MMCLFKDARPPREKYSLTAGQAKQLGSIQQSLHLPDTFVARLHKVFKVVDFDHNGTVDKSEFLAWVDEPIDEGKLAAKCFSLHDHDLSATIEFVEFVGMVYNYCSLSKDGLVKFVFALVDHDRSGHLTITEIESLVNMVYGIHLSAADTGTYNAKNMTEVKNAMTVVKNLDKDHSGEISLLEFSKCAQLHPFLIFPAFRLQTNVRRRTGGQAFWNKAVNMRKRLEDGTDLIDQLRRIENQNSCPDILEKKVQRKAYREKRRANGVVGPKETRMKEKMDRSKAQGAGARPAAASGGSVSGRGGKRVHP